MKYDRQVFKLIAVAAAVLLLSACGDGNDDDNDDIPPDQAEQATFRLLITNLTANQPFSEQAIIFHGDGYTAWETGFPSSRPLEVLAESGDPLSLLLEADQDPEVFRVARGDAIIFPGETSILIVDVSFVDPLLLTVAAMLANTNDAFAGLDDGPVGPLAAGQSKVFFAPAFDAGTEFNDELAQNLPGPSFGGVGFDPVRNDLDFVSIHPGVVSFQDGLTDSALDFSQRFNNPVMRVVVARID